ncbi:MAG: T9SS type A sorting domain-containing protein [Mariniphaga sp.]
MLRFCIAFIFLLFAAEISLSQVSQGGTPMQIPALKNAHIQTVVMPALDNNELLMRAKLCSDENRLKSFRFASGFEVNISPEKYGTWRYQINGYDIWQIRIRSSGAYSLSLVLDNFQIPEGGRLFLFNEAEGHYLGAFTSNNNKKSGKFAVSPVAGDEIVVQYEIPSGMNRGNYFVITEVNHDYTGLLKNVRRPMQTVAGLCNIDVNCPTGEAWSDVKDAVCRIIISKRNLNGISKEVCTGTLINNTAENQNPYILTAAHCINKQEYAETAIFTFNYESPLCAPLDGDPVHSISGAKLLASSDSLDFALLELSLMPPPEFRAFYAGWDNRKVIPDSSVSIHHPLGDIKKIAVDKDSPGYSDFSSGYTPAGFLKIAEWDEGVTEDGSSGGALFNPEKQLIGTLTGGAATCYNPVRDYYSRFDLAWEYRTDSSKQLKYWLDPLNKNVQTLSGNRFYEDENLCIAYSHLDGPDKHQNILLRDNGRFAGYWGGSNSIGITEFVERYVFSGQVILHGLAMGIGKLRFTPDYKSEMKVNVYNGGVFPGERIFSKTVKIDQLTAKAMNYIDFQDQVMPADTFFVGFELSNMRDQDTLTVYQSLRQDDQENFFWYKQQGEWFNYQSPIRENFSITNVFELLVCNVQWAVSETSIVKFPGEALIYPNPANGPFAFETGQEFIPGNIHVFNLLGQEVDATLDPIHNKKVLIDLTGNIPGIYFVQLKAGQSMITRKVSYMP